MEVCEACGGNHTVDRCPLRMEKACFICGKNGHSISNCTLYNQCEYCG